MKIINRGALSFQYIPDHLLHRDKETEIIKKYLEILDKGDIIPNIIIYGPTGSGKTSVIKHIIKNIQFSNIDIEYLNGRFYNTTYRVLSKITGEEEKIGYPVSYFINIIKNREKHLVVAIDEADFIRDIDDLLYSLSRLNDDSEARIAIILITNSIQLKSKLDVRTLSSLNEREIFFTPYTADQLIDILEDRIKIAIEGDYDKAAISKIAAIAAAESGDARYALKILMRSIELAENDEALKLEHVDKALESIEFDIIAETIKSLPVNIQIVIYVIAKAHSIKPKDLFDSGDILLSISDLYNSYVKISENLFRRKPKSLKWFKRYLEELESMGLISTVAIKGKNREIISFIRLGANHKDILKYFDKYHGIK